MGSEKKILLIDLPTFPKGVIPLSFPAIAACLPDKYTRKLIDFNLDDFSEEDLEDLIAGNLLFVGIKVSCQNYLKAIEVTKRIKNLNVSNQVVWGGEFPTLLPDIAIGYADAIVSGSFENVASLLVDDVERNTLQKVYKSVNSYSCSIIKSPDYSIIQQPDRYLKSMGFPMETSRGCDKKCTFCMVHVMQPSNNFKSADQLKEELMNLKGQFVNIIDYNIGSDPKHLDNLLEVLSSSDIHGWLGEMCLETLDNEELLKKLKKSRCKIIYCGLESISETSLKSINKAKTNNISNYARIIKNAQKYGVQIAAGIIVGMAGSNGNTIRQTFQFYHDLGLIYAKVTFLTYNPGTKVYDSMKRVGSYLHEEPQFFDGNHFTYLPAGVNKDEILKALSESVRKFYTLRSILKRGKNAGLKNAQLKEFIYFNICYRYAYIKWIKNDIFVNERGFEKILHEKFKKSLLLSWSDRALTKLRKNSN